MMQQSSGNQYSEPDSWTVIAVLSQAIGKCKLGMAGDELPPRRRRRNHLPRCIVENDKESAISERATYSFSFLVTDRLDKDHSKRTAVF